MTERFAFYLVPDPDDTLYQKMSEYLGYNAATQTTYPKPAELLVSEDDWVDTVRAPRKYGFHTTVVAPFYLATERRFSELKAIGKHIADSHYCISTKLNLALLHQQFIALIPTEASALRHLHETAIKYSQAVVAPLTEADLKRRQTKINDPKQQHYLEQYGYPWVFEFYQPHFTLSKNLDHSLQELWLNHLNQAYHQLFSQQIQLSHLALCVQKTTDSPFVISDTFALKSANLQAV